MSTATLTSKGQITFPSRCGRRLALAKATGWNLLKSVLDGLR